MTIDEVYADQARHLVVDAVLEQYGNSMDAFGYAQLRFEEYAKRTSHPDGMFEQRWFSYDLERMLMWLYYAPVINFDETCACSGDEDGCDQSCRDGIDMRECPECAVILEGLKTSYHQYMAEHPDDTVLEAFDHIGMYDLSSL